jgi:hypothetical protein
MRPRALNTGSVGAVAALAEPAADKKSATARTSRRTESA